MFHDKQRKKEQKKEEKKEEEKGTTSKRGLQLRSSKFVKILIQLSYSHFIVFNTMLSSIKY